MFKKLSFVKYAIPLYVGALVQNKTMNQQLTSKSQPTNKMFQEIIKIRKLKQSNGYLNYRQYAQQSFGENVVHNQNSSFETYGVYFPQQIADSIDTYQPVDPDKFQMFCFFRVKSKYQSHDKQVANELMGYVMDSLGAQSAAVYTNYTPIATAYLDTQYLKQLKCNQEYMLTVSKLKQDGRKVFASIDIYDHNGQKYMQSKGLFVTIDWNNSKWKIIKQIFYLKSILQL